MLLNHDSGNGIKSLGCIISLISLVASLALTLKLFLYLGKDMYEGDLFFPVWQLLVFLSIGVFNLLIFKVINFVLLLFLAILFELIGKNSKN